MQSATPTPGTILECEKCHTFVAPGNLALVVEPSGDLAEYCLGCQAKIMLGDLPGRLAVL